MNRGAAFARQVGRSQQRGANIRLLFYNSEKGREAVAVTIRLDAHEHAEHCTNGVVLLGWARISN